jgi:PDZ domain
MLWSTALGRREASSCLRNVKAVWLAPIVLFVTTSAAHPQSTPSEFGPPTEVQRLIDQLGSRRFADREAATRQLIAIESARPHVERLRRSPDEEIATRARKILTEHDQLYAKTRLDRFFRYGHEGQVERMVEGLAQWTGPTDNEEFWQSVRAVAVTITAQVRKPVWTSPLPHDFVQALKWSKGPKPVFRRVTEPWSGHMQHGGFLSSGAAIRAGHLNNATAIATAPVSAEGGTASGILFTTADFESGSSEGSRVVGFVIISAGRVSLHQDVRHNLIIARDGIDATNCKYVFDSHLASSGKIAVADKSETRKGLAVEASQVRPLGFIKWFETSTIGFESGPVWNEHKVATVTPGSVADSAGLRASDVITRIDGEPVKDSREEFRKQLRRGSVQDACELTVVRTGRTMSIVLDFGADNKK